jgi:hypothetical protein
VQRIHSSCPSEPLSPHSRRKEESYRVTNVTSSQVHGGHNPKPDAVSSFYGMLQSCGPPANQDVCHRHQDTAYVSVDIESSHTQDPHTQPLSHTAPLSPSPGPPVINSFSYTPSLTDRVPHTVLHTSCDLQVLIPHSVTHTHTEFSQNTCHNFA